MNEGKDIYFQTGKMGLCVGEITHLNLSAQQADTTGLLDLVLSLLGEVLGLHDDGTSGQMATTQQLVVALKENRIKRTLI